MSLFSHAKEIAGAKLNHFLNSLDDPRVALDYSEEQQRDLLAQTERALADVVTSKKELEMQLSELEAHEDKLEAQAKMALSASREDLAREALTQKAALAEQRLNLQNQIQEVSKQEEKMRLGEQKLRTQLASFSARKEVLKAQYTTAEAQVHAGEAAAGIGARVNNSQAAFTRAEEQTRHLQARAAALDELADNGDIGSGDPTEAELAKISRNNAVDTDLARLKAEMDQKSEGK